ncbi:MAG: hypothetical protein AB1757_01615 [Acidobacteriota bacterium]
MVQPNPKRNRLLRFLKRLLTAPLVFIAAIFILLEDWLWDDLARLAAAIGRLPIFHQIENLILKLPPYAALFMFAAPSLLLFPIKLLALYFISHGQATLGMATVIGAKFAGTALVARIFTLTKPKLMRIKWFARLHDWFIAFKHRIYGAIKATVLYRFTHRKLAALRLVLKAWMGKRRSFLRRRWQAAVKLFRRQKQLQD